MSNDGSKYFENILEDYKQLSSLVILQKTVMLDAIIEEIIAWYFCADTKKHVKFLSLIFRDGEITFSQKTKILKKILQYDYPNLYKQVSLIFNRLDKIRELRNIIAHSPIGETNEDDSGINAIQYKNGEIVARRIDTPEVEEITGWAEGACLVMLHISLTVKYMGNPDYATTPFLDSINEKYPTLLKEKKK